MDDGGYDGAVENFVCLFRVFKHILLVPGMYIANTTTTCCTEHANNAFANAIPRS